MSFYARLGKLLVIPGIIIAGFVAWIAPSPACVGRTIYIGYYEDEPEQEIMATLLTIFVDERTGTSVKRVALKDRKQGFDFLRRNKVSILVEYPGRILDYYDPGKSRTPGPADFESRRAKIGTELRAVFVTVPGFDNRVNGKSEDRYLGKAYIILSKKALSVFPAMPRLLKKLSGRVDNGAMTLFLENTTGGRSDRGTRSFLKKNKLI